MAEQKSWKDKKLRLAVHFIMSATAGYMGAYTLVTGIALFGNSQTANMIGIAAELVRGDLSGLLLRITGLLIYALGIVLAVLLPKRLGARAMLLSPVIDAAAFLTIALLPCDTDSLARLYPAFFSMAFQWASFTEINGYVSATIFSTNNFRQMVSGFTEFFCTKEREQLNKALFFAGTLLSFNITAGASYYLFTRVSEQSILFGIPVAAAAFFTVLAYVVRENRKKKTAEQKKI